MTNKDIANKDMTQAKYHAFSSHHSKWSDDSSRRVGHWRPCGWLQRAQSLRPKLYVVPTDPASNLSIRISVIADLPRSVSTNCKLTTNWKTAFSLSSLLQCLRVAHGHRVRSSTVFGSYFRRARVSYKRDKILWKCLLSFGKMSASRRHVASWWFVNEKELACLSWSTKVCGNEYSVGEAMPIDSNSHDRIFIDFFL